jgi:hypothetical protein
MANARQKAEQADMAARKAREESDLARLKAKEYAPEFHQPGTERHRRRLFTIAQFHQLSKFAFLFEDRFVLLPPCFLRTIGTPDRFSFGPLFTCDALPSMQQQVYKNYVYIYLTSQSKEKTSYSLPV